MVKIDEDRRREFERQRLDGGGDPIEAFLPAPEAGTYASTLEELVLIDFEVRWKDWAAGGHQGRAPGLAGYCERFPLLQTPDVQARLRRESSWLAERHGNGLVVGESIGRYRLRGRLGRGAFADVWRAYDEDLDREVALKVPRGLVLDDPRIVDRMQREAQAAARLSHPGIVSVFEVGHDAAHQYVACELIDGPTLAERLRDDPFDPEQAARLVMLLSEAVGYAHTFGVVHRDIKPANVLLAPDGRPKLADFGLARLAEVEVQSTKEGDLLGTPSYMAPEQVRGEVATIGPPADIYALGVLLYELLAGRPPFQGRTTVAILRAVLSEEPLPARTHAPGTPLDLETICLKAMSKEVDPRYESAEALAADLRRFLTRQPIHARPQSRLRRARLWARRNRALAFTILLAALTVGLVGGLGLHGVFTERARFQGQRDEARVHLGRSLMRGAEAYAESKVSHWYERSIANLTQAATLLHAPEDRLALRDLAAAVLTSSEPHFAPAGSWPPSGDPVRLVACAPQHSLVAGLTSGGQLWIRSMPGGEVVASLSLEDVEATALAWAPGGTRVLLGLADGRVQVRAGDDLRLLFETARGEGPVSAICVHRVSGQIAVGLGLATGAAIESPRGGAVDLLRVDGDRLCAVSRLPGHEGGTHCLDFSPDGECLLSGGEDGMVRLWDVAAGQELGSVSHRNPIRHVSHGDAAGAAAAAFTENYGLFVHRLGSDPSRPGNDATSVPAGGVVGLQRLPDGLGYLSAGADGRLRLHREGGEVRIGVASGHGPIQALSRGGMDPVIVAAHANGYVSLWRLAIPYLAQGVPPTHRLGFRADTHRLHIDNGVLQIESDRPPRRVLPALRGHTPEHPDTIVAVRSTRDGVRTFILRLDGSLQVSVHGAPVRELWKGGLMRASWLAVSPDGGHVAAGTSEGLLRRWSVAAGDSVVPDWEKPHGAILDACYPDSSAGALLLLTTRGLLRFPPAGAPVWVQERGRRSGALAACGALVGVVGESSVVELLDPISGLVQHSLQGSEMALTQAVSTSSGERLLTRDAEGTLRYWDLATEVPLWENAAGPIHAVHYPLRPARPPLVLDPLGRFALVADPSGWMRILDLDGGGVVAQLEGARSGGSVDPSGGRLLASGRGRLQAWDIQVVLARLSAARRLSRRGQAASVTSLWPTQSVLAGLSPLAIWGQALSPDGNWLAQTDHIGVVDLIRADDLGHVRQLSDVSDVSWTCMFAPDSKMLAAGIGTDVHLFDIPAGTRRTILKGHTALVRGLAFHPRLPLLVSVASDGAVRLWDLVQGRAAGLLDAGGIGVRDLAFRPDGGELAVARSDGSLAFWRVGEEGLRAGSVPERVIQVMPSAVDCVTYSASGAELACGAVGGGVCLLDPRSGSVLLRLESSPRVRSLAFSFDGRYLAASAYAAMGTVWDLTGLRVRLREIGLDWASD